MRMRLGIAVLAALATGLFAVSLAFAHSRPVRFEPAPGAVLTSAPSKVDGWFTNELRRDPNWSFIQVTDSSGARVDSGETTLSADRRQMTASLKPGLANGRYVVSWRTYDDSDGAIFGDCFAFYVGQEAGDAAVSGKQRLDGGGDCPRLELEAKEATPTADAVATAIAGGNEDAGGAAAGSGGNGGDVPWWTLVIGIAGGLIGGGAGAILLGGRS